jgi:hypothetical protein
MIPNWFSKTSGGLGDLGSYSIEIPVEIYSDVPGMMVSADPDKVTVHFNIELEYRSWGIKGVYLSARDNVAITLLMEPDVNPDASVTKTVTVDLSKVKTERVEPESDAVTLYSLDLWLDKTGNVDYGKTVLNTIGA